MRPKDQVSVPLDCEHPCKSSRIPKVGELRVLFSAFLIDDYATNFLGIASASDDSGSLELEENNFRASLGYSPDRLDA